MQWTKKATLEYFKLMIGREIVLEDANGGLRMAGAIGEVYELDLCSTDLFESSLKLTQPALDISVTFHEDFLGLHIMVRKYDAEREAERNSAQKADQKVDSDFVEDEAPLEEGDLELSIPVRLAYADIKLTGPGT